MMWRRREDDLERELRLDLEQEAAEFEQAGLAREEARLAAMRTFGNVTWTKEEVRQMWGWSSVERVLQDLRFGFRMLRKSPAFTAVAVLSLALGIGANTAIFSVLDAVLLKALPVSHADELRIVTWLREREPQAMKSHSGYNLKDDRGRPVDGSFSYPAFEAFRTSLPQVGDFVAFGTNQFTVTDAGASDLAYGHFVSGNYFEVLGRSPLLGRPMLPEDDRPSAPRVAVLSYQYWIRHFGGDPSAVNRVIQVNRQPVTVVGVMPRSFQGLQPGRTVDLFVPMAMLPEAGPTYYSLAKPEWWWLQVFLRLKPGVSEAAATAAAGQVFSQHVQSFANSPAPPIVLEPGDRGVGILRDSMGKPIYILAGVAGLVLLIACANLANLLLARYSARTRELAIRVSIGASRGRLIRQMLAENLVLAGIGAGAGLLLARPLFRVMLNLFSGTSPLGIDAGLDLRTLAFTCAIASGTALLFGLLPAWRASRMHAASAMRETGALANRNSGMLVGRGLVAFQIAISLLLVAGTGLLVRTLVNLSSVDLGLQASNLLTFQTDPERSGYPQEQASTVYRRIESRLMAIAGVESVGISQLPLMGGVVTNGPVRFPGSDEPHTTWFLDCSDSFLSTMRIPVVAGRDLTQADFDHGLPNAVVNETFVRKYLADRNPLGQTFVHGQAFTIVGVAKDAHYRGVRDTVTPTAYLPFAFRFAGDTRMVFAVRTRVLPESLALTIRQAVASVDPHLPVSDMRTEREQIDLSLGTERLFAALLTAFGAIALVLAAVGLYGIMTFSVSRRTPEIGVRLALGARPGDVQWLVLRQSLTMTAVGIVLGVPAVLELSSLLEKLLYGIKPNDALSIAGAVVVLALVAALAAWIPARRAARVDPMSALRFD